jgi:hypothetical protein
MLRARKMALGQAHADILKRIQAPHTAAVSRALQPVPQGRLDALPTNSLRLLKDGVPHGPRVPALPTGGQEGTARIRLIAVSKILVDQALPVQARKRAVEVPNRASQASSPIS